MRLTKEENKVRSALCGDTEVEPCFGSGLLGRKQTFVRSLKYHKSWDMETNKYQTGMIHRCPPSLPRYCASMWLHDTNNTTWLMRTMKTGPDACGIRPFSRLRIFMPGYVSCRRRLLRWHEFRRTRMHRCSYKPRLGEGWKSFLPYYNWTAAIRHRQQVEAHSSGEL